jgi:hypothetical protein
MWQDERACGTLLENEPGGAVDVLPIPQSPRATPGHVNNSCPEVVPGGNLPVAGVARLFRELPGNRNHSVADEV